VAAGVNAYLPSRYVEMAQEDEFFVALEEDRRVGFFTIRRVDRATAEIPLIYLDLARRGEGFGSECMRHIERWIAASWSEVSTLFLDTVIPNYNGGFYRKMGFDPVGETFCELSSLRVRAVRFEKRLDG
jgi:GNAT superfamily N-acetyltransferase